MFRLFRYKDLFKKIFVTIGILILYRVAMLIFLPGVNVEAIPEISNKSGFLSTLNVFSGGGIDRCSILATNIMPYITSSILIQIFSSRSLGLDYFQKLKNDRELGSSKLNQWTQYTTFFVSLINAIYITYILTNTAIEGKSLLCVSESVFYLMAIPSLITGSFLVIWLSNQISKFGIGQGVSVIIFANIISNSVSDVNKIYELYSKSDITYSQLLTIILFFVSIFCLVVFVEGSNRFVPIKYAGMHGKNSIHKLPLKINNSGILTPVISSSLAHFPQILLGFLGKVFYTENLHRYVAYVSVGGPLYYIFSITFLFIFTVTQSELVFDPVEISKNLQESGAIVVGVRPGQQTATYLKRLLNKLNFLAAIYLICICIIPEYFCKIINNSIGSGVLQLSGTTVLILVSTSQIIFQGFMQYDYKKNMNRMKLYGG
jgi:preprotein translocase subunit SecY